MDRRVINKERLAMLTLTLMIIGATALTRGNGMASISGATRMVIPCFDPATKFIYTIGIVMGLIGGVKVYNRSSSGDPDTSKTAISWFGACILLIIVTTILRSFFL